MIAKESIFEKFLNETSANMRVSKIDDSRPWGGFLCIDENDTEIFISKYFPHLSVDELTIGNKLSPKILIVAPKKRLSWQYHFRRAEIWKVIGGTVGIITSETDDENEIQTFTEGKIVELKQGERHRLIGLNDWGIIAEIWRHTDPEHPSDESDIVRVQDDYGR